MATYGLFNRVVLVAGSATVWAAPSTGTRWRLFGAVITPGTATGGCYALLKEIDSGTTSLTYLNFGIASNTGAIWLDFTAYDGLQAGTTSSTLKFVHNSSSTICAVFWGQEL